MYPRISTGSPLDPWRRVQGDVEGSQKAGRSIFLPKRCQKTSSAADELKPGYVRRCQGSSIIQRSKLYLTLSVFSFLFSYFTRFPLLISSSLLFSSPIPSYQIHLISSHCTSLFPSLLFSSLLFSSLLFSSLLFSSLLFSSPLLSHPIQSHLISSLLSNLILSPAYLISRYVSHLFPD